MNTNTIIQYLEIVVIVIAVITAGIFAVNQMLGAFFKAQLLINPCSLCANYTNTQATVQSNPFNIRILPGS